MGVFECGCVSFSVVGLSRLSRGCGFVCCWSRLWFFSRGRCGGPPSLLWGVAEWGVFVVSFLFWRGFWAVFWSLWVLFSYWFCLRAGGFVVVDVDFEVAIRSAELRSRHGIPMADRVVAAMAQIRGCPVVLDDPHFLRCPRVNVKPPLRVLRPLTRIR